MLSRLSTTLKLWLLSISFGLLMTAGWVPWPFPFLLLVGFIPILFIEDIVSRQGYRFPSLVLFEHIYAAFFLWNLLTTWWIYRASLAGAALAIFANALLMCLPILLFHQTRKILGGKLGYASLLFYWISFEFLHHQWELTWPWLTLGNGLAPFPILMQWYEFTGVFGGSLWLLATNLLLYLALRRYWRRRRSAAVPARQDLAMHALLILFFVAVPVLLSVWQYTRYQERGTSIDVVVLQPNIDPYQEKYNGLSMDEQLARMLEMSHQAMSPEVDYLVWPETSLQYPIWLHQLGNHEIIAGLRQVLRESYPATTLITGTFAYENYPNGRNATATARQFRNGACCWDVYNSAMQIDTSSAVAIYHKSKLVPGVERMPYPGLFKFLGDYAIELGGTSGSLGTQATRDVFFSLNGVGVAPVICYESVFGDYVADYIRNGAQTIFIITNDGWWGNTPGHVQHLHYASLRAIETRRSIARSANTGISCFINQRGDILQATAYDQPATVRGQVTLNSAQTFYVRYGDLIGRGALIGSLFMLLAWLGRRFLRPRTKPQPQEPAHM